MYHYKVWVVKVLGGDTIDLSIDLGFHLKQTYRMKLSGVKTPEQTGDTYKAGLAAELFLRGLIYPASISNDLYATTTKDTTAKYGKYEAKLTTTIKLITPNDFTTARWTSIAQGGSKMCINDILTAAGHNIGTYA